MTDLAWLSLPCADLNKGARAEAFAHQEQLTKPPGALGRLEEIAVRLAAMQGTARPSLDRVQIAVFAGDHGIARQGVSAFPQAVTAEMVRNFARGGAAINVLARQLNAALEVIDLGTVHDTAPLPGVHSCRLGPGTADFTQEPAMTPHQLAQAMHTGRNSAERAKRAHAQIYIGGEMGIGNTTAAAALACALLGLPPERLAGPGTGLNNEGVAHKAKIIASALALHAPQISGPTEVLRRLGGFEIAALTGAFIACAQMGLPVLVDGFIATAAALTAERLRPGACTWFFFSHASAEPGHLCLCQELKARPLLDLGMRLGEGSGAAVAVPLLRLACALHNEMATFAQAGIAEKITA